MGGGREKERGWREKEKEVERERQGEKTKRENKKIEREKERQRKKQRGFRCEKRAIERHTDREKEKGIKGEWEREKREKEGEGKEKRARKKRERSYGCQNQIWDPIILGTPMHFGGSSTKFLYIDSNFGSNNIRKAVRSTSCKVLKFALQPNWLWMPVLWRVVISFCFLFLLISCTADVINFCNSEIQLQQGKLNYLKI